MQQSQDAALVRTMRPLLNRWLGGFGDALSGGEDRHLQKVEAAGMIFWKDARSRVFHQSGNVMFKEF